MTDIPNSSKSPYWLKRSEARGTGDAGDADVRGSEYSLRSIPAWDPNYLGSSLLAKRIRKTLALIDDRLNTIAVGGVDNALLEQLVNTVLAGMNLEGLNEAQVNALIAPVGGELKDLLSNMASIDGSVLKPATVERAVVILKGMYTETVQAAESLNNLVWGLAQKPGGPASVDQAVKAVWDAINALAAEVAAGGGGGQLGAGLTPEQLQQIADAVTLAQGVVDIIGGKPQGGATLADVAAVFGDLGATFDAQIAAAIAEIPLGLTEESWTAILEEKLTDLAPMIFQAVQSQMNALPERIRLNVKDASPNAKVVIEALNLTATGPNPNPVSMDIETPGGTLSVNGKRVLTIDDALTPGSVDQAAVEAAVAAATAPLLQRIADLEAKQSADHQEALNYSGGLISQFSNDLSVKLTADFAKKADKTELQTLMNAIVGVADSPGTAGKVGNWTEGVRIRLQQDEDNLTQLYTMLTGKADKTVVQQIIDAFGGSPNSGILVVQGWREAIEGWIAQHEAENSQTFNDIVEFVLNNYVTKATFQSLMDAMNGPGASPDSIMRMFWLLNDVIVSLIEATGIELPEGKA